MASFFSISWRTRPIVCPRNSIKFVSFFILTSLAAFSSSAPSTKTQVNPLPPSAFTRFNPQDSPEVARLKQNIANGTLPIIETSVRVGFGDSANNKLNSQQDKNGAQGAIATTGGLPILHRAVVTAMPDGSDQNRAAQAIQMLIDQGADVNAVDDRKRTALHMAAELGHLEAAGALIRNGADMEAVDAGGMTPLGAASAHCQADVASMLVEAAGSRKADYILMKDKENWTALHDAARGECTSLVRMLLKALPDDRSEDIFSQSKNGWTPLSLAARRGSSSVVKLLSSRATHPDQLHRTKPDGLNALHMAVWNGHKRTVEFILDRTKELLNGDNSSLKPYITQRDGKGWNSLHFAVRYDRPEILALLIEQLNDQEKSDALHAPDDEGWSPLHMAARYGKLECLAMLLRHAPGNIDAKKDFGWTPLLLAVFAGHANVTTFLVYNGADPSVKNDEGVDAFIQARQTCSHCERILELRDALRMPVSHSIQYRPVNLPRKEAISVGTRQQQPSEQQQQEPAAPSTPLLDLKMALLKRDIPTVFAILDSTDNSILQEEDGEDGYPVLHLAVHLEDSLLPDGSLNPDTTGLTKLFLARGADVNRVDKERKETALHLATRERKFGAVKALIDAGSDIYARDFVGGTPLLWAASTCPGSSVGPSLGSKSFDEVIWPPFIRQRPLVDLTALDQWRQLVGMNYDTDFRTTLDLLLEAAGKNVTDYILNDVDHDNASALHLAAVASCVLGMEQMLEYVPEERNAEIFRRLKSNGLTPLSIAAGKGPSTMVKLLAARAPNIDYLYNQDNFGNTALHRAVMNDQLRAVEFLLDHTKRFANAPEEVFRYLGLQNKAGASAYHVAAVVGRSQGSKVAGTLKVLIDLLDDNHREATLHAPARNGMSPLHYAAYHGNVEQLMLLLAAAPGNMNAQALRGVTPLMFATAGRHSNVTALLVWNGADITVRDDEGQNAVDYAFKNACFECLPLLAIQGLLGPTANRICPPLQGVSVKEQPLPALPSGITQRPPATITVAISRPTTPTPTSRPVMTTTTPPQRRRPEATTEEPFDEDAGKPPPPQVPAFIRPGGIFRPTPAAEEEEEEEGGDFDVPPPRLPVFPPQRFPPPARTTRPPPPARPTSRPGTPEVQRPPFGANGGRFPSRPSVPTPAPRPTFGVAEEEAPSPLFPPSTGNRKPSPVKPQVGEDTEGGVFPPSIFGGPAAPRPSPRPRPQTPSPFDEDIFGQPAPPSRPGAQTNVIDDTTGGFFPNVPDFEQMFGIAGPEPNIPPLEQQTNNARPDEEDMEDGRIGGGIGRVPEVDFSDVGEDVLGGDFPEPIGQQQGINVIRPQMGSGASDDIPVGALLPGVGRPLEAQRPQPPRGGSGPLDNLLPEDVDNEQTGGDFPEPPGGAGAGPPAAPAPSPPQQPPVRLPKPVSNAVLPDRIDFGMRRPSLPGLPRPQQGEDVNFSGGIGELPGTPPQSPTWMVAGPANPLLTGILPQQQQKRPPPSQGGEEGDIDGGIDIGGGLRPAVVVKPTTVNLGGGRPAPPRTEGARQPAVIIVPQLPGEGPLGGVQDGRPAVEDEEPSEGDVTGGDFPSLAFRKGFGGGPTDPEAQLVGINVTDQLAIARSQAEAAVSQFGKLKAALEVSTTTVVAPMKERVTEETTTTTAPQPSLEASIIPAQIAAAKDQAAAILGKLGQIKTVLQSNATSPAETTNETAPTPSNITEQPTATPVAKARQFSEALRRPAHVQKSRLSPADYGEKGPKCGFNHLHRKP